MSDNYNELDTTNVKVTRVDEVVEQESVPVVEKVVELEPVAVPVVVAPALVVQRPVLCFLENLVRPF